ncbi:hypothetical protein MEO40_25010 [Dolichospermum sp. ST_sed1]|nr:hypothetical protein [Dolichospermum sp. ST_sed1]MDD1423387.1 hypothetical protein [Dolichospermum sp. ST_sed9]MDD1433120.1 hypothetical protein [Dolichospermum sp. ST_sed6]MDD1439042.1 hypothetical protein [Dolichospermum sp. ST_sed3]MDD1448083.1 hypothetical protein [Dolichospermum sp. ST_sed8]MDD1453834.1 hypothetical protein [Dolichospermum sp. ST_sed7]MDD1459663.1 hypothetical protein [Dolichospermum sp. ST_sed2]MDD1463919.1 hypothetical protein [Dolichospermum sp. ST_sed5]MDD147241
MSKNSHITAAVILTTLALTGCTIGETPTATNNPSPVPNPVGASNTPVPQATGSQTVQPPSLTQPFNNPIVSSKLPVNSGSVASLIQPTNGTERLGVVQKGRTDPFGQIVEPIGVTNTKLPGEKIAVPKLPPLPTIATLPKPIKTIVTKPAISLPKKPTQVAQKPLIKPVLPTILPGSVPSPKLKTVLPVAPQPETAKAVIVTGVVLIGKVPQAIVKVPDEPTSRYVQPGQRLVNGVLVKRIEMSKGANPTVIFEQYGIEVAKQVGEQPIKPSKPATTASLGNAISVIKPIENLVVAAS